MRVPRVALERVGVVPHSGPWFNPAAVAYVEHLLRADAYVLEVGAGRSTAWYAQRGARVTSVETDPEWFQRVAQETAGFGSVRVELVAEHDVAEWLAQLPAKHYDLAILDGLEPGRRLRALEIMSEKVSEQGVLIHDDSDWPEHRPADGIMRSWHVKAVVGMKPQPFRAYETRFYSRHPLP